MIDVKNVSKSFGGNEVLKNVSLSFESQKIHILLGASGCGKSTLLKMIMGLIPPDSGDIQISVPDHLQGSPYKAQKMGYVIQDGGLFPHLTVRENITLVAQALGLPQEQTEAKLQSLCQLTSFQVRLLDSWPIDISGGQKQRASLMRALFLDPPLLLMDEPLGALDPLLRNDIKAELKAIFSELKKTVIFVTHDLPEASYLGDTITLLHKGRIEEHALRHQFFTTPQSAYAKKYIESQWIQL